MIRIFIIFLDKIRIIENFLKWKNKKRISSKKFRIFLDKWIKKLS